MQKDYTTIIKAEDLAQHIDRPDWRIMDCRFDLSNKLAGQQGYAEGHIPGSLYAHLEEDLSGPLTETSGRHPLPDANRLAESFAEWGIGNDSQLIVYDDRAGAVASRLWWLSRWLGHKRVAVLTGGFAAWQAAGLPTSSVHPDIRSANFIANPDSTLWLSTDTLECMLSKRDMILLDAREPARYRGETEPLDKLAGHITGAINYPFVWNLDADGKFLTPDKLQARFLQTVTNVTGKKIVHYCGSGVTACHNILALEIMGLPSGYLYPGSWSEWITDSNRPVSLAKAS